MSKQLVLKLIGWSIALFCTFLFLWKIFGNSPTEVQLLIGLIGYFIYKSIDNMEAISELKTNNKHDEERFLRIEKRLDESSKDFKEIKHEIQNINIKLSKIDYLLDDMQLIKRKLLKS